jgi:hypothetical protein
MLMAKGTRSRRAVVPPPFTAGVEYVLDPWRRQELKDWLGTPHGTEPPEWLLRLLERYHPTPHGHGERAEVLLCDGGGVRLAAFAPLVAVALGRRPDLLIGSSASTFFMEEIFRANSPRELAEGLKAVANVPFPDLFVRKGKNPLEQVSAEALFNWADARTGGAKVNDSLLARTPRGLEGVLHGLQVTMSFGHLDASKALQVTHGVKLQPGQMMEVNMWEVMIASFQKNGIRNTSMTHNMYPHCLFEMQDGGRLELSEFGKLWAPVFGGDTADSALTYLDSQPQAWANTCSSRNPMGIMALAICLENGDLLIIADGQMLGPLPIISPNDMPEARIRAIRTMQDDPWHAYDNTRVQSVPFQGSKMGALDFGTFTLDTAYRMMADEGMPHAIANLDEIRREFDGPPHPDEIYIHEVDGPAFTIDRQVGAAEILWNSRGVLKAVLPNPAGSVDRIWQTVVNRAGLGRDGPDGVGLECELQDL